MKLNTNKLVNILMSVLVASFYIFEESSFGSIILLGITAVIFLLLLIKKGIKKKINIEAYHIQILVFSIFCAFSAAWAENANYAIEKAITIVEILLCMSVVYAFYSDKKDCVRELLKVLMYAGYLVMIYAIIYYKPSYILDVIFSGYRLENSFSNVNSIGMIVSMSIIISTHFLIYEKKWINLLFDIPSLILVVATGSRKAFLMVIIGIILVLMFKNINNDFFVSLIKVATVLVVCAGAIYLLSSFEIFSGINNRLKGLFALVTGNGEVDSSAILRRNYIKLGMDIFKNNYFLGIGMGNARIYVNSMYGHDAYLHNNYVELLANGGIVGFVIFYSIYAYIIFQMVKCFKCRDHLYPLIITMLLIQLIMDYGCVSYYSKNTYFYLLIFYLYISKLKQTKINNNINKKSTTCLGEKNEKKSIA